VLPRAVEVESGLLDRVEALGRAADVVGARVGGADGGGAGGARGASGADLGELSELVVAQVCAGLGAPAGMLCVVRGPMLHVVASQGLSGTALVRFPASVHDLRPPGRAVATHEAVWDEPGSDEGPDDLPSCRGSVPLVHAGEAVGAIVVGDYGRAAFTETEQSFVATVARVVAAAVHQLVAPDDDADRAVSAVAGDLPAFLRAVSAGLSGDTVSLDRVDRSAGTVATVLQHEENPAVAAEVSPLLGVSWPLGGTLHERVTRDRAPVFVPDGLHGRSARDVVPVPWQARADRFPVHGLIAVPVLVDGRAVGVLVAGRRRPGLPYAPADLDFVLASAHRLEGLLQQAALVAAPASDLGLEAPTRHARVDPPAATRFDGRFTTDLSWPWAAVCGVLVPALTTVVLRLHPDPGALRPASVLLGVVVALTVLAGFRTGLVATVTAVASITLFLTTPYETIGPDSWEDVWGLCTFSAAAAGVLLLVARLRHARTAATRERLVTASLLDGSPIGLALLDRDLRIVEVNDRLSEMTGRPRDRLVGLTPAAITTAADDHESVMREVLRTGRRVDDHQLSHVDPTAGIERYWRASFFPLRDLDRAVSGIGISLEEVTGLTVARRRAEALLELGTALTGVVDVDGFVVELNAFLARAFGGRGAVGLVEEDRTHLRVRIGPWPDGSGEHPHLERDRPRRLPLSMPLGLTEAVVTGEVVEVPDREAAAARYPATTAQRVAQGTQAWVSVPLRDPFDRSEVVGAFQVAWSHRREITSHSRTLLRTIGAMAELVLSRIRIAEAVEQDRFRTVLDAMVDSVVLGRAVRDDAGEIVDFEVEFANAAGDGRGRSGADVVGRRVSELYPDWMGTDQFRQFVEVVESGRGITLERVRFAQGARPGGPGGHWNLQVAPFGDDLYIASSRDVTDIVIAEAAARDAAALEQRERIAIELLQRAALPEQLPEVEGTDIGALYQPAASDQTVGGDWYDAFPVADHQLALVIADVAGHGREAAALMVQVRNIFRAVAVEHRTPATVLSRVNDVVLRLRPSGLFVTCCYAVLDTERGDLSWGVAGHPPPVFVAGGTPALGEAPAGPPLAVFSTARYHDSSVTLGRGDRVYLYTDGLVERRGEPIDVGLERLCASIARLGATRPQRAVEALGAQVDDQFDDLAVLCVERR
jgi:PAS domain S-box-containing protein